MDNQTLTNFRKYLDRINPDLLQGKKSITGINPELYLALKENYEREVRCTKVAPYSIPLVECELIGGRN